MKFFGVFLAISCSVIGAQCLSYANDDEFQQWVLQYFTGASADDLEEIYPIWRKNAEFVKYHNSLGLTYTLGMNKYSHLVRSNSL